MPAEKHRMISWKFCRLRPNVAAIKSLLKILQPLASDIGSDNEIAIQTCQRRNECGPLWRARGGRTASARWRWGGVGKAGSGLRMKIMSGAKDGDPYLSGT